MIRQPRSAANQMSEMPKRLRFGLKSLLLILTLFAVAFGMYFVGYRNGYRAANEGRADYVIWSPSHRSIK
jgi:hypothetical protein